MVVNASCSLLLKQHVVYHHKPPSSLFVQSLPSKLCSRSGQQTHQLVETCYASKGYHCQLGKIQPKSTQDFDPCSAGHIFHTLRQLSQTYARCLCNHPAPRTHQLADDMPGSPSTFNHLVLAVVPHSPRLTPLVPFQSQPRT